MSLSRALLILSLAAAFGFTVQWRENKSYEAEVAKAATTICDVVTLRAQGGSTRDVLDQAFSFLRKFAPDPTATVLIRNGGKELGALSDHVERFQVKCAIANTPDYEIISSFAQKKLIGSDLAQKVAWTFLFVLALSAIINFIVIRLRRLWFNQILLQLRFECTSSFYPTFSNFDGSDNLSLQHNGGACGFRGFKKEDQYISWRRWSGEDH